jgi:hypothetical protein
MRVTGDQRFADHFPAARARAPPRLRRFAGRDRGRRFPVLRGGQHVRRDAVQRLVAPSGADEQVERIEARHFGSIVARHFGQTGRGAAVRVSYPQAQR